MQTSHGTYKTITGTIETCRNDAGGNMKNSDKTKVQLLAEIEKLKTQVTKLEKSELKSSIWLENSPVCTKILDLDFNLQYMNSSGIRELKIDNIAEFYGKPYPLHFYPDSFKIPMTNNLKKVKETGIIITQEASVYDIDGKIMWYQSTIVPIYDEREKLDYIMVVSLNITKIKQAERALRIERDNLNCIFNAMQSGIYIVNKDYDIEYLNPVLIKDFGPPEGKKCYMYFHDSDEPCSFCKNKDVFAGKTVGWEWTSPKGRTYDLIDTPLKNEDGSVSKLEIFKDITERKKAEDALRESEENLNALFTSMTEMVVMHELVLNAAGEAIDYRIIDCNKVFTKFTGIRKEDAIGKLASEVYQTNPPPSLEKYAKVGMGGDPHEFTTFYPPLDKHFMVSVVSPQAGKFATITTDISAMMQIQEMILAKNKEMENYLYVASHDLRTPLVNIQGFSQRLKTQANSIKTLFTDKTLEPEILHKLDNITDENIPKTLSFILSNIEKMEALINGLLQLSRPGTVEMNIQKIDMNALFAKILQSLDFQIKEAQCKIHINPLPECYGDAALLDQLFANIISNALKYSDSERTLEITVDAKKIYNRVVYTIRDNGKGIAQKHLDKIWDVFYRIDPRSAKTGEGIGLSLVKRIAEKHRGKVWAESEENRGSVFNIELHNRSFTES
jgi:signal transduction histidine kinase